MVRLGIRFEVRTNYPTLGLYQHVTMFALDDTQCIVLERTRYTLVQHNTAERLLLMNWLSHSVPPNV